MTSHRPAVWRAIRHLAESLDGAPFTAVDIRGEIAGATPLDRITTYLKALTAAGYLERVARGRYRLVKDPGVEAPRITRQGRHHKSGCGQQAMWDVLRTLRSQVTAASLIAHINGPGSPCSVALATAQDYLSRLAQAGYCKRDRGWFRLVRVTGPKAPRILKSKALHDPNTGQFYVRGRAVTPGGEQ